MLTMTKARPIEFPAWRVNGSPALDFFRNISTAAQTDAEKQMVQARYVKQESIFFENDPARFVWFVQKGHVKEVNHSADGKDQTICMVGANGIFGVSAFDGGEYGFHGVAETEVIVASFPIQDFQILMRRHPDLAAVVLSKITKLLRHSKDMQTFAHESAEKRLLYVLVNMAGEFGNTIPLTRKEMASLAGTSVETCIRIFSRLKDAGLIAFKQGKLTVNNAEHLKVRMEKI